MPLPEYHEEMANVPLHTELINRKLDYLYTSILSVPSRDQPSHGGCLHAAIMKWTWDSRAVACINKAYSEMGLQ